GAYGIRTSKAQESGAFCESAALVDQEGYHRDENVKGARLRLVTAPRMENKEHNLSVAQRQAGQAGGKQICQAVGVEGARGFWADRRRATLRQKPAGNPGGLVTCSNFIHPDLFELRTPTCYLPVRTLYTRSPSYLPLPFFLRLTY